MPRSTLTLAAIVLALAARPDAQVAGTVVDRAGRPIEGATVTAQDGLGAPRDSARTDAAGRFRMRPAIDSVQLVARRIGFEPAATGLIATGEAGDVTLVLARAAQALRSVVVEERRLRQGFAERMAAGGRHKFFLDSAAVASRDVRTVEQLVDRVPYFKLGASCVVIDGTFVGVAQPTAPGRPSIFLRVALRDLRGVEIYEQPMSAPAELRRMIPWQRDVPQCARLVMLWTEAGFEG
jgi:hypothetical protein